MNGLHGIILAYEERDGLKELVGPRCSASIPFGGRYRVVDFALSNMVNAGVTDVGVVTHSRYQSLLDHLGNGKAWDLSRKRGGLRFLPPFNVDRKASATPYRGNVEALAGIRSYLESIRQDYVVITDGDLVANMPFAQFLEEHVKSGADITAIVADDCKATDDGTYFETDGSGKVTAVLSHLNNPRGNRGLETFFVSTELLKKLVDECTAKDEYSWRKHVLQAKLGELDMRTIVWKGYAAQVRSVKEYYERDMELLDPAVRKDLFTPDRPITAKAIDKPSAYIGPNGSITNSLMGDGCRIEGIVEDSILFSGVTVEEGAVVKGCILFREATVRKDARVSYVIGDKNVEVLAGQTVAGTENLPFVLPKFSKV